MKTQTSTAGITFAVQQVERATKPLPTCKTQQALNRLLGDKVEACCDYTSDCLQKVTFHPLLAAAHFAFSQHRPLVLSPDMIWVTIVQGLAQHVKNHAERLRDRFVGHQGKLEICVQHPDLCKGSPENAWDTVIHDFSLAMRKHLGPQYDNLIADYSTTGRVERTACEVALLDAFQPYFAYVEMTICGIPEVTLEGTAADWQRLRAKMEHLAPYDLDWWLPQVRQVCDQFVRAAMGDIDLPHWQDLYKRRVAYGWDVVNGWLVHLIPYLQNGVIGSFTVRNSLLIDPGRPVSTNKLPSGISQVPFLCRWPEEDAAMEFLGGFVGVTQDVATLALRPKLGWAVRRSSAFDQSLVQLSRYNPSPPLDSPEFDCCIKALPFYELPADFLMFYKKCNGVRLFGDSAFRLRPLEALQAVEMLQTQRPADYPKWRVKWDSGPWVRFCDLPDGTFVAIELQFTLSKGYKIIRGGTAAAEQTGTNPIIAWSFTEFLEKALSSGGRLDVFGQVL